MTNRRYTDPRYDGFQTASEILEAIETLHDGHVYDEASDAYRVWSAPTEDEFAAIAERAWQYADPAETRLTWGAHSILR
jgi:hypothetical protein